MLKWFLVLMLVVVLGGISSSHGPVWGRWRLGQLPGDVRLRVRGRNYHFPFTSTLLLSLLLWLLLRTL